MAIEEQPWLTEGEDKREAVKAMFGDIAPSYDLLNSLMCFRLHHRWRRLAVARLGLKKGESALDICSGTGDFLFPILDAVGTEGRAEGIDFCRPMLDKAQEKLGQRAVLTEGDACALPYQDSQFDGATIGWGLRNVPDQSKAIREAVRVLKPGARFVCLDMTTPANNLQGRAAKFMFHKVVPMLGSMFGKTKAYKYLPKSTEKFMTKEQLADLLTENGFEEVGFKTLFFGNICMHWGTKS